MATPGRQRRSRGLLLLSVCLAGGLVGAATPAGAAATVTRVSLDIDGGDPNGASFGPSIDASGRYVAFMSSAPDLVAGDRNHAHDVFVRDLATGAVTRASVDADGGDADGQSIWPQISANGRHVAFTSWADDLVAGDANVAADVYVRDLVTGSTTRVSVDPAGGDPLKGSSLGSISATGRYVAFASDASDLVPGDGNRRSDVFVRDVLAATTTMVSVDVTGGDADGDSWLPSISATGRYVAFTSAATDLVAGDGNGDDDVFVRDLATGTTARVSVDAAGADAKGRSGSAAVSATGRHVAFHSKAPDVVAGEDDGGEWDVFVRDLATGTTALASVGPAPSSTAVQGSLHPSISADGRYVSFSSDAPELVPGDGNAEFDAFHHDLVTGATVRLSVGPRGVEANGGSFTTSITAAGDRVVFDSDASNLVRRDGNGATDVFLADPPRP